MRLGVAHTIFCGCGAHDIFWVWRTRYFREWRTRYLLEVAHTIFVGSGAHGIFWEWRTQYLLDIYMGNKATRWAFGTPLAPRSYGSDGVPVILGPIGWRGANRNRNGLGGMINLLKNHEKSSERYEQS